MTPVATVNGALSPQELGHIAPHEHLLANSSAQVDAILAAAPGSLTALGIDPDAEAMLSVDIALGNHYWMRRHAMNRYNLTLDDEDAAAESLDDFASLGGSTIVECTPIGLQRNPSGLVRLSQRCDVNIIMGCGWYLHDFHPDYVAGESALQLSQRLERDLTTGVGDSGVRAGIIGEIGTSWPLHPDEVKVLQAAAMAQAAVGAAVQVHPGRHPAAPQECLRILERAGADPARISLSHLDRTYTDLTQFTELASSGCLLEFDMFGQESSYYPYGPFDVPNDAARVRLIADVMQAGYTDQILISQDLGYRTLLPRWGGPGYAHILREVLPLMRRHGYTEGEILALTRTNPARWLCGTEVDACEP